MCIPCVCLKSPHLVILGQINALHFMKTSRALLRQDRSLTKPKQIPIHAWYRQYELQKSERFLQYVHALIISVEQVSQLNLHTLLSHVL